MTDDPAQLTESIADHQRRVTELKDRLGKLNDQVLALTDEAEQKRALLRQKFRELHDRRFKDVDPKRALVGGKAEHAIVLPELAAYYVAVPKGSIAHAVESFIINPVTEINGKSTNYAPVSAVESILLGWLVGIHAIGDPNSKRQDLTTFSMPQKLEIIRHLPENLASRIAEECTTMQGWLNTILEIELGKS